MKNLYKSTSDVNRWMEKGIWKEAPTFTERQEMLDRTLTRLGVTDEDLEKLGKAEDEYRLRALYSPVDPPDFSEADDAFVKKCFQEMGFTAPSTPKEILLQEAQRNSTLSEIHEEEASGQAEDREAAENLKERL